MKKRKYQQTARAEQAGETRQQIVEATVFLHEKLGPANTSIKAIAEQAGVQRLTVYRHFPDELSLFAACTSHWLAQHPPPDMAAWADCKQAHERTATALLAFYRYYRKTTRMWTVAYRDMDEVEALQGPMNMFEEYLDLVRDDLLATWKTKNRKQLSLTLRHCLRFTTWQSLMNEKLSDKKIVELTMTWL